MAEKLSDRLHVHPDLAPGIDQSASGLVCQSYDFTEFVAIHDPRIRQTCQQYRRQFQFPPRQSEVAQALCGKNMTVH